MGRARAATVRLDQRLRGLDGTVYGVASLVDGVIHLAFAALDCLLCLVAETLSLSFEVVACVLEIIACVLRCPAELLARLDSCLRSVEESDCGSCADADAEGEPVVLCTHSKSPRAKFRFSEK